MQLDDLGVELAVLADSQQTHRNRQIEAARAAGAGIEVEHALAAVEVRHVRVAEEHGGNRRNPRGDFGRGDQDGIVQPRLLLGPDCSLDR